MLELVDECWIHTDAGDFDIPSATLVGYNTNRKSEVCQTPDACVVQYETVQNTFSIGGTPIPNQNTVTGCQNWCTQNQACGAFDFNSLNECYWHNNGDWENTVGTGNGVTQYRKMPCPGQTTPGGTPAGTRTYQRRFFRTITKM